MKKTYMHLHTKEKVQGGKEDDKNNKNKGDNEGEK